MYCTSVHTDCSSGRNIIQEYNKMEKQDRCTPIIISLSPSFRVSLEHSVLTVNVLSVELTYNYVHVHQKEISTM